MDDVQEFLVLVRKDIAASARLEELRDYFKNVSEGLTSDWQKTRFCEDSDALPDGRADTHLGPTPIVIDISKWPAPEDVQGALLDAQRLDLELHAAWNAILPADRAGLQPPKRAF